MDSENFSWHKTNNARNAPELFVDNADTASNATFESAVAHALTTQNQHVKPADSDARFLPPFGFSDRESGQGRSTYQDELARKIKSRLRSVYRNDYQREAKQMDRERQSQSVDHHSLHLTPAHDLVDSKVRVAEHDIELAVKAEMSPEKLQELDKEEKQYVERLDQTPLGGLVAGPVLKEYINQVHKAVHKF